MNKKIIKENLEELKKTLDEIELTKKQSNKSQSIFDEIQNEIDSPITLSQFLGIDDHRQFTYDDNIYKILNDKVYIKNSSNGWDEYRYLISEYDIEYLQNKFKRKTKPKLWKIFDQLSFNDLMIDLEMANFVWFAKKELPTNRNFKGSIMYVYADKDKYLYVLKEEDVSDLIQAGIDYEELKIESYNESNEEYFSKLKLKKSMRELMNKTLDDSYLILNHDTKDYEIGSIESSEITYLFDEDELKLIYEKHPVYKQIFNVYKVPKSKISIAKFDKGDE
jgi:hypothetical protein